MRKLQIECPDELVDELQRTYYKITTTQAIVDRYLDRHSTDSNSSALDSDVFNGFMAKLVEQETKYDLLKQEVTNHVLPEYIRDHQLNWNLNFSTGIIDIDILCDCVIPELEG